MAYRQKAAIVHPDVSEHPDAAWHFLRITAAYEVLLQFANTAPASRVPAARAPEKQPDAAGAQPTDHETSRSRDQIFAARVTAWREYWQVALQASQMVSELELQEGQLHALKLEMVRLREQLATLMGQSAPSGGRTAVDSCRMAVESRVRRPPPACCTLMGRVESPVAGAQYARCASQHADVTCAVGTMRARVRVLQAEATRLQACAQNGSCHGHT